MDPSVTIEPPRKKNKVENSLASNIDQFIEMVKSRQKRLTCVLADDLFEQIPTVKVYSGHIRDLKDISKAISVLNEKVPLKELSHLKRVRRKDIVLCTMNCLKGMSSIQEYMDCNVEELKDMFEYFKEIDVPSSAPLLTSQFKDCSKLWSCNFHPNKYLERLVDGTVFNQTEDAYHTKFMTMAFETAKWYLGDTNSDISCMNAAVVVDPNGFSVVAAACDDSSNHPIKHAAMLAIDNVAKTQNGGAWTQDGGAWTAEADVQVVNRGVDVNLMAYLKKKFSVAFGAKEPGADGPYLCTGYYVYLIREPCCMCAMALVHARVKRVFFTFENRELGALKSRVKLQTVASLNHHFEVFTGFLESL